MPEETKSAPVFGKPYCYRCGRHADEIEEYSPEVTGENLSAGQFVLANEGTYNPATNRFCCTDCYIAIGAPSSPNGWRAP